MAVSFFPCTGCEAKIRSPRPLSNGTQVRCPKCAVVSRITEDMNASPKPARLTTVGAPMTGRTAAVARAIPPASRPSAGPATATLTKPLPVAKRPTAAEPAVEVVEDQPKKKKKKPAGGRSHPAVQAALLVFALGGIGFGGYMIYDKLNPKPVEQEEAPKSDDGPPRNVGAMPTKGPQGMAPPKGGDNKGGKGGKAAKGKDQVKT